MEGTDRYSQQWQDLWRLDMARKPEKTLNGAAANVPTAQPRAEHSGKWHEGGSLCSQEAHSLSGVQGRDIAADRELWAPTLALQSEGSTPVVSGCFKIPKLGQISQKPVKLEPECLYFELFYLKTLFE